MMEIDCRKLSCPQPLLRTKRALEENRGATINVLVDNAAARDNIMRFAQSRNLKALWKNTDNDFIVEINCSEIQPGGNANQDKVNYSRDAPEQKVIMISSDQLGRGSEELGALLMRNFIFTLTKQEQLPRVIIFINSGVRLCAEGSPVLDELQLMQSSKVEILACGTCLDYYDLKESLRVGKVGNIFEIAELLGSAAVITL